MAAISIHTSTDSEIPLIKELAHRIWWDHYPSVISNEQIVYMLDLNYSEAALKSQMDKGSVFYLAYEGEKAIGYVAISPFRKESDSYFIHKFYVETSKHSKGIGTKIFNKVLKKYEKVKSIRLAVNRQNYKSINFYFKNGFKIENCLDTKIGRGFVMDDFIMIWKRP